MRNVLTNSPEPAAARRIAIVAWALVVAAPFVWRGGSTEAWIVAAVVAVAAPLAWRVMRAARRDLPALALATACTLAVAAPAFARHTANVSHQASPQAAVRDFLSAAVVDNDGVTACRYLSPLARNSFEHRSPYQRSCEIFFSASGLTLGGLHVQSDHDLNELSYRVVTLGTARRVIVSHGGQSIAFVLRPASPPDVEEFWNPPTPWRIDSSVAMLASPQPRPLADV